MWPSTARNMRCKRARRFGVIRSSGGTSRPLAAIQNRPRAASLSGVSLLKRSIATNGGCGVGSANRTSKGWPARLTRALPSTRGVTPVSPVSSGRSAAGGSGGDDMRTIFEGSAFGVQGTTDDNARRSGSSAKGQPPALGKALLGWIGRISLRLKPFVFAAIIFVAPEKFPGQIRSL